MSTIELTYTGRERSFVTWSAILDYAFDFYNLIGAVLSWPLFWCYALWGLGQGSIGVFGPWYSELFPVELRSTGASVTFTGGRLIGSAMPYLVPVMP